MKTISRILQFIFGFTVGILILTGVGFAAGYYFFTKMASRPPRPVFAEEQNKVEEDRPAVEEEEQAASSPSPKANPSPEEEEEETTEEEQLEPGEYKATVNWPEGLILRDQPGEEAGRIGGIAFNQEIIVVQESDDGNWQQVRIPSSGEKGWIKAGNVDRVEASN